MPFCVECGARLEDGAKFCTSCGAKQPELQSSVPAPGSAPDTPRPYSGGYAQSDTQASQQNRPYTYDPTIYSSGAGGKKKGGGKLVFVILAALAVIAAIVYVLAGKLGGGSGSTDQTVLGRYSAAKAELGSMEISISDMWDDGFSIELKDKGRCEVNVDGSRGSAKWELDGEALTIKGSGLDCSGSLSDGVLVLEDVMGTGVKLTFTKEGVSLPTVKPAATQAPTETQTPAATQAPAATQVPETAPDAKTESVLGSYYAVKAEAYGIEVPISTMWENGFSIELQENGVCVVRVNNSSAQTSWTLDGDKIEIPLEGLNLSGTLADDTLIIEDVMGTGMTLSFSKDGAPLPAASEAPAAETPAAAYDWWNGNWYGWWVAYDAGGIYEEQDYISRAWDVCGTIEVRGDNSGTITLWDEDEDIAQAEISFSDGLTDKGSMTSLSGSFYNDPLDNGEWVVDPGADMSGGFDDLIAIHGTYYAAAGGQDWIEYYIFLRPWGLRWDDIAEGDTSGMIYPGDMLPINYTDWYLPLIEAGQGMPEAFEGLE